MLTEKENRERIFTEIAQHITSGKLTLSLEERELIVKALNYYSLAKLQPEGDLKTLWSNIKQDMSDFLVGNLETDIVVKFLDFCDEKILTKLSPYLLQAKEEERERIVKLIENWDMEGAGNSVVIARKALLQALSSPATEKEGK